MATEYDDEADGSPGKEVLLPVWNKPEPYFEFMDKLKPILSPGKNPWRVASDDKRISTHKLARTRKCLVAIHPHAIAISSPYGRDRSLVWFAVVLLATFSAMFAYSLITELMSDVVDIVGVSICIFAIAIFFFCGMWAFNFAARMPSDWPIMFNKVDRTVSFIRPTRPKFFKFWQFTNSGVVTYPWDTVKVRSYKVIVSNAGKSFHESYYLVLFWGGAERVREEGCDGLCPHWVLWLLRGRAVVSSVGAYSPVHGRRRPSYPVRRTATQAHQQSQADGVPARGDSSCGRPGFECRGGGALGRSGT
ncbi:hypothetical protein LBW59_24820 [Ralstonia solanacearum]|uniref:Transmembrane protein n=1 Tax=Ralstonia solanacearum TaxID=305 RepID=A0AAW5ZVJ8_RALSL|nr:hypothetical protein [Ralstonia solanacearum]MDB0573963.1 hypothetical protein [Ralstonia solanacearum]